MSDITHFPPRLPIKEIGAAVEALIDLLNKAAGDPDLEDNGDAELDGTDQGDTSCPEWLSLGRYKVTELTRSLPDEDVEDDDGDGECTDDEPAFDARSRAIANGNHSGPGCIISASPSFHRPLA
jgi:hypothetical protein